MNPLLLGDPNPSLRWRAAVELDGAGEDDGEVGAWRTEIDRSDDISALVARLDAAADHPQVAGYLLCQLAYLGYRGPAIPGAVERILDRQQQDGSWPAGSYGDAPHRSVDAAKRRLRCRAPRATG